MKRISVNKRELVAELIDQIIDDPEEEIVLAVPKGSNLGASVSNFHLLSREAKAANKKIVIESVDESLLALARSSQIEAIHPFLDSRHASALSDITPRNRVARGNVAAKTEPAAREEKVVEKPAAAAPVVKREDTLLPKENPHRFKLSFNPKALLWVAVLIGIVSGGIFIVNKFWSEVKIDITFKKVPWSYDRVFTVDTSVSKADLENGALPGELFALQKNLTQLFQASGKGNVSVASAGKMIIYNNYGSKPQVLVATTRFETPDGKIFRIPDQVTVPAASMSGGKVIPSKVEVKIVADKPGPAYNVGPVGHLTIPGFKGSPRYNGFYGEIVNPTTGGFVGERFVPTAQDITNAKNKTTEILKSILQKNFLSAYSADLKILDGASEVNITKLNVNTNTDKEGKFSVFGEAGTTAIGFKESDLKSFLLRLAERDNPKMVFKELNLSYKSVAPDFSKKKMIFSLSASGNLWPDFKKDDFAASILGKKVSETRSLISSIENLSTAKISIWPVWLRTVPKDASKIKISVY